MATIKCKAECKVEWKNITHKFGSRILFKDFSGSFEQGSKIALMGKNGAGKTSFLNILRGFIKPFAGDVFICGKNIKEQTSKERAQNISYLPQNYAPQFDMTVLDFVELGGFSQNQKSKSDVLNILNDFDLMSLCSHSVLDLSGGELQRVLFAQNFFQNSKIVLMDEPFNHLDEERENQLLDFILNEQKKRGFTLVASLHNKELAQKNFDKILCF